jgi:hypothetical protein
MIYLLGILISGALGFLLIRLLTAGRLHFIIHLLLALALGLGIDGTVTFYTHILFNQFNRFLPIGIVIAGTLILFFIKGTKPVKKKNKKEITAHHDLTFTPAHGWGILTLVLLSLPLAISAHHYPLGGWDAWSCWNLKAKFIFLGQENWKDVLAPGLWRSNTHYPLLWPLINVWFWDLGGKFDQAVPMLNSIVFALLTAGILLFGLLELTGKLLASIAAAVIVTALPFGVTLYTSQYSDSLLGLYLLSSLMCMLLAEKYNLPKLKILSMVFLGLMSFTKNEGLVAAGITVLLILWHELPKKNGFPIKAFGNDTGKLIFWFVLAALPTIIFTLFMAPKNEAFINGLTSMDKPTNWMRLSVIAVYPCVELVSGKWCGFWVLVLGGVLLAGKKLWRSTLGMIGLSLILYVGTVMTYYAVNTFFEISWWLSTTLSRILFALIPTIALWIGTGLLAPPTRGEKMHSN